MCPLTVMAPQVVGAMSLSKFRPIAGLCAVRKILGSVFLQVAPSTAVRECADGVLYARRCWSVFAAESGRAVSGLVERKWCSWT